MPLEQRPRRLEVLQREPTVATPFCDVGETDKHFSMDFKAENVMKLVPANSLIPSLTKRSLKHQLGFNLLI